MRAKLTCLFVWFALLRVAVRHNLLLSYDLYKKMEVYRPHPAHHQEMTAFHSRDYVDFLQRISPESAGNFQQMVDKCKPAWSCFKDFFFFLFLLLCALYFTLVRACAA